MSTRTERNAIITALSVWTGLTLVIAAGAVLFGVGAI